MKIKFIFLILSFLLTTHCYSQIIGHDSLKSETSLNEIIKEKYDVRISILKVIGKHIKSDELFRMPKNNAFLFSIGLSVNNLGKIDSIYFAENLSKKILAILIQNDKLTTDLKKVPIKNNEYKNKLLIFSMLFKRPEDDRIANLNDFLNDYVELWPIADISDKKIVLLKPFINDFFDPIR